MKKDFGNKIGDFMDHSQICYLSSIDEDGFPNTKAVSAIRGRDETNFFFIRTKYNTVHVEQFKKNPKASIYFCDPKYSKGLMVRGNVSIIEDKEIKDKLWKDSDSVYYAQGKDDQNYCMLRFDMIDARFFNNFRSEDICFN